MYIYTYLKPVYAALLNMAMFRLVYHGFIMVTDKYKGLTLADLDRTFNTYK